MKTRILNTDYVSFKFFLKDLSIQQQLQKQLSRLLINLQFFKEPSLNLPHKILAVSRLSSSTPITYRCAIAMQLSSKLSLSPIEIAQQVFSVLKAQSNLDDQEFSQLTLTMKLIDPGWLDFEVSDHTLVLWLQLLGQKIFSQPNLSKISGKDDNLFLIEYTYARCCSLLRLGETEGLITLKLETSGDLRLPWKVPDPIPWLNNTYQLRLTHQSALALINQVVITVDRSVNNPSVTWNKLGTQLSESILDFERNCRIFGDLAQTNLQLSQARLGLIAISQHLLKWLWYSHLGNFPRSQL
jgi:Arginyl tRNA synthetase N terminal domain